MLRLMLECVASPRQLVRVVGFPMTCKACHVNDRGDSRSDAFGLITKSDAKRLWLVTDSQLKGEPCIEKKWYRGKKYLYSTRRVMRLAVKRFGGSRAKFEDAKGSRKATTKASCPSRIYGGYSGYHWGEYDDGPADCLIS
mmetsp:Transcript_13393/g.31684  ORF Transcript_13393/g.31684 Transcript_13393/m.31684 type:complete len:140 (+) Transcript_13393:758-1177(+)